MEEARGNAGGRRATGKRDERKPGPERVARSRMSVVRQRIEEKIDKAMSREMVFGRHARSKNQSRGIDATRGGGGAKIRLSSRIARQKPKHRALYRAEQTHPDVKKIQRDLRNVVEAAEDEGLARQAGSLAGWRAFADAALAVIGEVKIGQTDELFGEEMFGVGRRDDPIYEY